MSAEISLEGFPIESKIHPRNEKPGGESASIAEYTVRIEGLGVEVYGKQKNQRAVLICRFA
jgi:hypothetical protein